MTPLRAAVLTGQKEAVELLIEKGADINAKNNYILMHRIHYDNWVKALNAFKETYEEKLLVADPSGELENMPLFELPS